jgi:hypothetical protein
MHDPIKSTSVKKMKTEHEIIKRLEDIENELLTNGPFREWETITRKATKQALEWVLEESEILLNC